MASSKPPGLDDTAVSALAIDPGSRQAVSGHVDGTIAIWELDSAECVATARVHEQRVKHVLFGADGLHVISAGDDRMIFASAPRSGAARLVSSPGRVLRVIGLSRAGDRDLAILLSWDGHLVRVMDLHARRSVFELRESKRRFVTARALDQGDLLTLTDTAVVEVWPKDGARPRLTIGSELTPPLQVVVGPRDEVLILADACGRVAAWKIAAGARNALSEYDFAAHGSAVRAVALDESAAYMVTVGDDGLLRVGCAKTGETLATWPSANPLTCCAVTSALPSTKVGYRVHARTRAPLSIVAGDAAGHVVFIACGGLAALDSP